jgi:hypothetical protein
MSEELRTDGWNEAWSARYEGDEDEAPRKRRLRLPRLRGRGGSRPGRYAVISAFVIAVVAAPFAVAATSGRFQDANVRYTLYAKNVRSGDGGAGALVCNSNTGKEPCLSMVNKGNGLAAAFRTRGLTGFRLQTSGTGTATPFILDANATGKVEHFNADQLDGKDSTEIGHERWALVTGDATPAVTRGTTGTTVTRTVAGDYRVAFADDVNACSYQVTSADPTANRTTAAVLDSTNNKQVRVVVKRAGGANEGELVDGAFQIAVIC